MGAPGALGENGASALDLLLTFLNDPKFNLSLRGSAGTSAVPALLINRVVRVLRVSCVCGCVACTGLIQLCRGAGMALMKLCEMCRRGEESWAMVRRKVADSNTMKNLVLLLLRKDDDNPTKPAAASASTTTSDGPAALPGVDEAAFTNKAMVLDVLYALSNLDSFENEVDAGDMGERVIKAGGCVITCALLNRLAAEQQQQQQQPALGAEHDARTKARVEVIRAAVGLLSSMAFVTGTRQSLCVGVGPPRSGFFMSARFGHSGHAILRGNKFTRSSVSGRSDPRGPATRHLRAMIYLKKWAIMQLYVKLNIYLRIYLFIVSCIYLLFIY